ncbi:MAG TPA: LuxR C-terminal-related transcriptional regulator [Ktedonobacteraceae bacterium]|jgi:LuxR family maltose regulon positive regulatory protein
MAQPEGYQRLFLDEGESIITLLRAVLPELRTKSLQSYARDLLSATGQGHSVPAIPIYGPNKLTAQEQRVLRLFASGHSKAEIAQAQVVSINTVKTQLKTIYRKLNITSRKDACEAAQRLHLL